MVVQIFNPVTWEAEAGRFEFETIMDNSMNSRTAGNTQRNLGWGAEETQNPKPNQKSSKCSSGNFPWPPFFFVSFFV